MRKNGIINTPRWRFDTIIMSVGCHITLCYIILQLSYELSWMSQRDDKTVAILQSTMPNAFHWIKIVVFWFKFHCLLPSFQMTALLYVMAWRLKRQVITWTNDDPVRWRKCVTWPERVKRVHVNSNRDIEAEPTWPPFSERHFQMHFLEWKCMNFDYNFIEVCF